MGSVEKRLRCVDDKLRLCPNLPPCSAVVPRVMGSHLGVNHERHLGGSMGLPRLGEARRGHWLVGSLGRVSDPPETGPGAGRQGLNTICDELGVPPISTRKISC